MAYIRNDGILGIPILYGLYNKMMGHMEIKISFLGLIM
jgi:hypothetical protein